MNMRVRLFTFSFSVILHCAICAVIFFFSEVGGHPEETVYHVSLAEFAPAPASQAPALAEQAPAALEPTPEIPPEPEVVPPPPPPPPKPEPVITPKRKPPEQTPPKPRQPQRPASPERAVEQPVQPSAQMQTGSTAGGTTRGGTQTIGGLNVYDENAVDQRPSISRRALPVYPERAKRRNIQGMVVVRIVVDSSGNPQQCIVQSSNPEGVFDEAALTAARKTRFIPGKVAGRPVNTVVLLPYRFALN